MLCAAAAGPVCKPGRGRAPPKPRSGTRSRFIHKLSAARDDRHQVHPVAAVQGLAHFSGQEHFAVDRDIPGGIVERRDGLGQVTPQRAAQFAYVGHGRIDDDGLVRRSRQGLRQFDAQREAGGDQRQLLMPVGAGNAFVVESGQFVDARFHRVELRAVYPFALERPRVDRLVEPAAGQRVVAGAQPQAEIQQVLESGDVATDLVELFGGHRLPGQGAELDRKIAAVGQRG